MRVNPDRQTLILAGEPLPRRGASSSSSDSTALARNLGSRVTIISARVDAVVTERNYSPDTDDYDTETATAEHAAHVSAVQGQSALPAALPTPSTVVASRGYSAYAAASRGSSFAGASAYARTQDLVERHPIVDTYA